MALITSVDGSIGEAWPASSVVLDAAGNIYGTTEYGGWEGWGTVYEITP